MEEQNVISVVNGMKYEEINDCIKKLDDEISSLQKEIVDATKVTDYERAWEFVFEYDKLNDIKRVLVAIRNIKAEIV